MKLKVTNLTKNYRQGSEDIHVLKSLDFEVEDGQICAVLGQSGSGKSTLLGLLAGLDQPNQGQIEIGGQVFSQMSENDRTLFRGRHIGIVFQSYHLVPHLTALENVMLPLEILQERDAEARALKLLEQVGLLSRQKHFPSQLSGGECQRVALARALVTRPQLILADEPSGHLDQETGQKTMDLFFEMIHNFKITTLLVTHDSLLASRCQRKVILRNGRLGT